MLRGSEVRLVLVVAMLVPVHESLIRHSSRIRKKHYPIWLNPCRATIEMLRHNKELRYAMGRLNVTGRNKASPRPLRRLRTQMNNTLIHFINFSPKIDVCNKMSFFGRTMDFDWLPKNQFEWYREEARCLDKKSKVVLLLPRLHEGLQTFAACLDRLRLPRDDDFLDKCHRPTLLADVADKLNQLLCELDRTMYTLSVPPPHSLPEEEAKRLMSGYGEDETRSKLVEYSVIKAYRSFLLDWHKIIRILVGKKGDRRCSKYKKS